MYCEKCGTSLRPESLFCGNCGQRCPQLTTPEESPSSPAAAHGLATPPATPQNSQFEPIIGMVLLAGGGIALIAGIVRLNSIQAQLAVMFGISDPKAWILIVVGAFFGALGGYLMLPSQKQ